MREQKRSQRLPNCKELRPHCLRQIRIALFSMGLLSMELGDKSSSFGCKPFSKWNGFKNWPAVRRFYLGPNQNCTLVSWGVIQVIGGLKSFSRVHNVFESKQLFLAWIKLKQFLNFWLLAMEISRSWSRKNSRRRTFSSDHEPEWPERWRFLNPPLQYHPEWFPFCQR